jgi:AraC-like DNA-binding protein
MGHLLTIRAPAMNETASTLPVLYVRQIADQVRSMGADVGGWLASCGLTEAELIDASVTIPYPLFERLVESALRVAREPALGLLVGERLLASTHGIVGYAAMNSGTIRQAIDLLERFAPLRISLLAISHEVHAGEVQVRFRTTHPVSAIERPLLEAVVLSIKNVLDAISMGACQVRSIAFPFAKPEYASLARDLFGCEVRYGQSWAGLAIPLDVIDIPLKLADPQAFDEAARICQRELDKLEANESLAARVRRLLLEKQNGFPSLQVTARNFRMTPRTLHRRLLDEGTSFRELLEEVRHTLAVEHLKSGRFSIEEIAYKLGYSDLANFRRAFKRWESVPPSHYVKTPRRTS